MITNEHNNTSIYIHMYITYWRVFWCMAEIMRAGMLVYYSIYRKFCHRFKALIGQTGVIIINREKSLWIRKIDIYNRISIENRNCIRS